MRQFASGNTISKYRVIKKVGAGGMGTVYLAEDLDLQRQVAIKVLHPNLAMDELFVERFKAEARAIAQLLHPNIVPVNSLIYDAQQMIIEMPYFSGGSLHEHIILSDRRSVEIVPYCVDILDALSACHAHELIHRDVKPSNILLDQHDRVLLADFGLAKAVGDSVHHDQNDITVSSMFIGTPRYAPLEAWEDQTPTPAWDLFSIGVILYEGLTGSTPFPETNPLAHLRSLEKNDIVPLRRAHGANSDEMEALVGELLAKYPDERPDDASVVRDRLMKTSEFEKINTPSDTISYAIPTGFRRKKNQWVRKVHQYTTAALPWAGWLLLPVLLLLLLLLPRSFDGAFEVDGDAPPVYQAEAFTTVNTPLEDFLAMRRFFPPVTAQVYASVAENRDVEDKAQWLLQHNEEAEAYRALGVGGNRIIFVDINQRDDERLEISGIWGAYQDLSTMKCLYGDVTGTATWYASHAILRCDLEFASQALGFTSRETVTLYRDEDTTDTAFLWHLEEDPVLLPLLANELLPRDFGWKAACEHFFPATASSRITVLQQPDDAPPIDLDGRLEDPVWKRIRIHKEAVAHGRPENLSPRMFAFATETGINLALQANTAVPKEARVSVAFLNAYTIPAETSPVYRLTFQEDQLIDGHLLDGSPLSAWITDCRLETSVQDGRWYGELFIPYETAAGGSAPSLCPFYRLTITVSATDDSTPLLCWGMPAISDIRHGCLLVGEPVDAPTVE